MFYLEKDVVVNQPGVLYPAFSFLVGELNINTISVMDLIKMIRRCYDSQANIYADTSD